MVVRSFYYITIPLATRSLATTLNYDLLEASSHAMVTSSLFIIFQVSASISNYLNMHHTCCFELVSAVWHLSSAVSSLFYTLLQVFESLLTMPSVLKIDLLCHDFVFPPTLVHSGLPPMGLPSYNFILYYTSICTLLCDFITSFHHLQTCLSVHNSGLH